MKMRIFVLIACFFMSAIRALAEDRDIAGLFARNSVEGSMVIESLHSGKRYTHDDLRANIRLSPASTFKILNTLVALQERAVTAEDNMMKWDGTQYGFPDWNRDQTLESAFRVSCVWYYQELARRVGAAKYRRVLHDVGYGKLKEPFEVTSFWLDGSLEISPVEQVDFLKKIYKREMPFSSAAYETLAKIMIVESCSDYTLRAKTGWAVRLKPQTGWYVGYLETVDDVWFFAMNINIRSEADLPLRKSLLLETLGIKGIRR